MTPEGCARFFPPVIVKADPLLRLAESIVNQLGLPPSSTAMIGDAGQLSDCR
jgi:hypothetical protein